MELLPEIIKDCWIDFWHISTGSSDLPILFCIKCAYIPSHIDISFPSFRIHSSKCLYPQLPYLPASSCHSLLPDFPPTFSFKKVLRRPKPTAQGLFNTQVAMFPGSSLGLINASFSSPQGEKQQWDDENPHNTEKPLCPRMKKKPLFSLSHLYCSHSLLLTTVFISPYQNPEGFSFWAYSNT